MSPRALTMGFLCIAFIGLTLTAVALFTPGWRHYKYQGGPYYGLITYTCGSGNHLVNGENCDHWWKDKKSWERAVIVLMFAALLFEIIIFFTFLATFCKSFQAFIPLSFLAFIATILLLISIILYGAKSNSKIAYIPAASGELNANHVLGYSYWLAVTSTIIMAIATVFGIALSAIPSRRPPLLITN